MDILYKFKNNKLRYREKFSNTYLRQLFRLGEMLTRHPLLSFKQGILKAMIGLTYRCQCSCVYCCSGGHKKIDGEELSTNQIESIVSQIAQLPSVFTLVSFFGGEPMLRDDIYHLVRYTTQKGLFAEMDSNGLLLSKKNVSKLKKAGMHHIFINLAGAKPQTHDSLSNYAGCFNSVIEAVKNCIEEELSCSLSIIALKEKIYNNEIKEIIELGKSLNVASMRILYPALAGNWIDEGSQILNEYEKLKVRELLEPELVYLESTYYANAKTKRVCQSKIRKVFYISPYGEVQPCPFVPLTFGNTRLQPLSIILNSMWANEMFNAMHGEDCFLVKQYEHKK